MQVRGPTIAGAALHEGLGDLPGDDPERDRAEKQAAIAEAGIDLDPTPPGFHRHGDDDPSQRPRPPAPSIRRRATPRSSGSWEPARSAPRSAWRSVEPAGRSTRWRAGIRTGASGSARWSTSAGLRRSGAHPRRGRARSSWPCPTTRSRRSRVSLRMYGGQAMIHTSGALGAEVLAPAMAAGTQIGAFHPLVAFADTERAVEALHGATIAIEGDDQLASMLAGDGRGAGCACRSGSPRARRPPTMPRRSWPPAGSSRCSTPSPSSAGSPASTKPGRWRSTARSSRGPSATPAPSASARPSPDR